MASALLILAACAPGPTVQTSAAMSGPYPALAPISDLLAQADMASAAPDPALSARTARLRARVALMHAAPR